MAQCPLKICSHCSAESQLMTLNRYEVGPTPNGHCPICGSLYCQKCLRPFLSHDSSVVESGLKIIGETIYCAFTACGAGHPFRIDISGRVVLNGMLPDKA